MDRYYRGGNPEGRASGRQSADRNQSDRNQSDGSSTFDNLDFLKTINEDNGYRTSAPADSSNLEGLEGVGGLGGKEGYSSTPDIDPEIRRSMERRRERVRERMEKRRKSVWIIRITVVFILLDVLLALAIGVRYLYGKMSAEGKNSNGAKSESEGDDNISDGEDGADGSENGEGQGDGAASSEPQAQDVYYLADRMAMQYDYDGAIQVIRDYGFSETPDGIQRIQSYEQTKATLVPANMKEITHIFFHILIVDTDRALTNDAAGKDFNQVMTSIPEFNAILEEMYSRGFVLVGLHDMAEVQVGEDGVERMVMKQIMLPPGKKPFVMSQDDVCYYEYMEGKGFADKMVLDENGKLKLQYTDAAGNVSIGDYDLVPLLDNFIEVHPDFSYHNHKAIIAFTGYNGILGYRTDETYDPNSENYDPENEPNPNIEADRETVKQLTKALVEDGYELSSHSWGHANFSEWSYERLARDTDRWERNVDTLLPSPCDIILYPFGADIGDWHPYTTDNNLYVLLRNAGFRYFCNVDSNQYWIQYGDDFLRQGRRNLDGYRLYEAYSGRNNRVEDLMDVQKVFDTRRPTPIGWEY